MYYTPKPRVVGPMPPPGSDVWWRAQVQHYADYDPYEEFEQPSGSHPVVELIPFKVVRYTPKGVWLENWIGETFFQLGNAIRQKAVPTKELALNDLIKRKESHLRIMKARLRDIDQSLQLVERTLKEEQKT